MSWTEMVDQNVTPEERLLRLIESGEKGKLAPKATKRSAFWDVRAWAKVLLPRREKANQSARVRSGAGLLPEFNMSLINRILVVFLVFLVAGIALNMNNVRTIPKDLTVQATVSNPSPEDDAVDKKALASLRPLTDYLNEVGKRDIFSPSPVPKPEKPEPRKKPERKGKPVKRPQTNSLKVLQEKVNALKLVGISWGGVPIAMIENTTKRETSFLKAGQFINDVQIKVILKDRVVLSYENAEYDLF